MSRICAPTPRLEVVETSFEPSESMSMKVDTTNDALRRRIWLWSALASRRASQSWPAYAVGASVGYRSSNSPFGSSALH